MSQLLAFQLGLHRLAAPIESVDGVQPLGPIARVPGAPGHLRGITTRFGYLLPVVDLPVLLGLADTPDDAPFDGPAWLVVLRHDGIRVAVTTRQLPTLIAATELGEAPPERLDVPALIAAALARGGESPSDGISA